MKTARYTSTLKGAGLAREYCYQRMILGVSGLEFETGDHQAGRTPCSCGAAHAKSATHASRVGCQARFLLALAIDF
jgi:hypothetical protein